MNRLQDAIQPQPIPAVSVQLTERDLDFLIAALDPAIDDGGGVHSVESSKFDAYAKTLRARLLNVLFGPYAAPDPEH
jgi:hypothetical protein